MKKRFAVLSILVLIAMVFSACVSTVENTPEEEPVAEEQQQKL